MYQPYYYQQNDRMFIPVNNEQEVLTYPVGCGNSVNFKMQNAPYLYTKTMGFSQFDKPVIEKYRLLKEELGAEPPKEDNVQNQINSLLESYNSLEERFNALKTEVNSMRRKNNEHNTNGKSN